jgi:PIN domain nuclease of toxin-antitoxin system
VRLLLDTHIWLWSHADRAKLSKRVATALLDEENELWLSPISIWEFFLLVEKGRIEVQGGAEAWVEEALAKRPMKEASLNNHVARHSRLVRVEHEDPADRFLAATAAVYDLVLVTEDQRLLRGKGFQVFKPSP